MEEQTKMTATPLLAAAATADSSKMEQESYVTGSLSASDAATGTSPSGHGEIWFRKLGTDEGLPKPRPSATCTGTEKGNDTAPDKLELEDKGKNDRNQDQATKSANSAAGTSSVAGSASTKNKQKKRKLLLPEGKRLERNSREQERSHQVSHQFAELRDILSQSGIVIPKGTKSAVLGISLQYIKALQEQQRQAETTNQELVHRIGALALGQQGEMAQRAVQHAGTMNGIWDLPSFQSCPTTQLIPRVSPSSISTDPSQSVASISTASSYSMAKTTDDVEYHSLFDHAPVPMAIASLGGTLVDCNRSFRLLTGLAKEELSSLTVFNLVAQDDLEVSFKGVSNLLAQKDSQMKKNLQEFDAPIVVKGSFANHLQGMDLKITLIRRRGNGDAQSLCVALTNHHQPTNGFYDELHSMSDAFPNTIIDRSVFASPSEEPNQSPNYNSGGPGKMEGFGWDEPTPFRAIG